MQSQQEQDKTQEISELLTSVTQKRRTVPSQWMELRCEITDNEITRLLNSKVILKELPEEHDLNRKIEEVKFKLASSSLSSSYQALKHSEKQLNQCLERSKALQHYLWTRSKYGRCPDEIPDP